MNNQILENEEIRYNVIVNGQVLKSGVPQMIAEQFVASLSEDLQPTAQIVPVTSGGKRVLFG